MFPLLPRTITYEILKNARTDFRSNLESIMLVSEEWRSLMESILYVKYNMYLGVDQQKRWVYYYCSDTYNEQIGSFAQLDELQCERLGELRIISSWGFSREEAYAVDFKEDSPTMKVQFRKLHVGNHNGDLDMLSKIVPTDFEAISMYFSSVSKCFPLPATLKNLDLFYFRFSEQDSWKKFLSFVEKMTWEEISAQCLSWAKSLGSSKKPLERIVIEAWMDADDPQLNHFQSDHRTEKEWHTFFEEIQHWGRRIDENTLHVDHKKLNKTLSITIQRSFSLELDSDRRLHMRCL
uniref:F-box domain-containing protein n=1 Tax=Steinernema glaseri TaxID=37863 RepID=A0A1I7YNA3_9BILA